MRTGLAAAILAATATAAPARASDVLYEALLGAPQAVDAQVLVAAPGQYVGRAVTTRGLLERTQGNPAAFVLALGSERARLKLEPEAAAMVAAHADSWAGRMVEVEGLFYRAAAEATANAHALRAWRVTSLDHVDPATPAAAADAPLLSLEALVYGAGAHDGRLVRVRGSYRGANLRNDLPFVTRHSPHDWVLKDGHFAAWVDGPRPKGESDADQEGATLVGAPVEVVGIPSTASGTVRIAARAVRAILDAPLPVTARAAPTAAATVPPRVTFAYPVAGQPLAPAGHMILQFNKSMDPARLARGVRLRFERAGALAGTPGARLEYHDRQRALVITPETPPAGAEVVVELLDEVVDVDGRRLLGQGPGGRPADGVVERIRFGRRP